MGKVILVNGRQNINKFFPLRIVMTVMTMMAMMYAVSRAYEHPGGFYSAALLAHTRAQVAAGQNPWSAAYDQLLTTANSMLSRQPQAMAIFDVPGYYDDADGHRAASAALNQDVKAAYTCALVYSLNAVSNPSTYAEKTRQILNAWASVNTGVSNTDGPLVMAYAGVGLVFAADILAPYSNWTAAEQQQFHSWAQQTFRSVCNSIKGRTNNWGDWGVLGSITASYYLDDTAALTADLQVIRNKINSQIEADGHMPEETGRGANGIWYTYFALAPLTAACQVAYNASGTDLFNYVSPQGKTLRKALDCLFYYSVHPDEWPYYTGSDLRPATPDGWDGTLFEAMSAIYDESSWENWVIGSRPLMGPSDHYAWSFPTLFRPFAVNSDPDTQGPLIVSVGAGLNGTSVSVLFDEPVEAASAANSGNYSIDKSVTVSAAVLQGDPQTVVLITSPLTKGITYMLTVSGVKDRATPPNIMTPVQKGFTYSACVASSSAWQNFSMARQSGTFEVTYDATPLAATCNGLVTFSSGNAMAYTDCAILVRFNNQGKIDVRNGGAYQADQDLSYAPNTTYHFRVVADIPQHIYSVYVTPAGGSEVRLASDYAFRSEQTSLSEVDTWNLIDDTGGFQVCDLEVSQTTLILDRPAVTGRPAEVRVKGRFFSSTGQALHDRSPQRSGLYIVQDGDRDAVGYKRVLILK